MTEPITEVRRFLLGGNNFWVVDILAVGHLGGYVRPGGTAGNVYEYEHRADAEAVEALYLAKNAGQILGVETSAEETKSTGSTPRYCSECASFDDCTKHEIEPADWCNDYKDKQPPQESDTKHWGHPDFYKLLGQMADLHSRKNHDYAGTSDPLKNLRACERLDLKPFLGVLVRLQDKWSRLEEFVKSGQLMVKNESVIDTLMDNAVYSLLAIILYQEAQAGEKKCGKTS